MNKLIQDRWNRALRKSMEPIPGTQTDLDEKAGKYTHVVYSTANATEYRPERRARFEKFLKAKNGE